MSITGIIAADVRKERERCAALVENWTKADYIHAEWPALSMYQIGTIQAAARDILRGIKVESLDTPTPPSP